ncbi:protein ITPRID2 isoform X1 [Tachysurus fulvidraco]|uniref:protein ITPRID2 isoform X1 n=1 Tax=Tachysurus fulvidraco TaxID=1234273 RepID=UPI001FEF9443|nr:protein ITPRID2 isoform X1 [Tachysurus fulvidraco]XP_047671455.1 protein ITPRID2 isoform X1 [Tachysurus fulvidraco]XP_047671456.1 protein ITPRID2 isoform X1 [Tachysurus fulvidraco]XP_047671457.1 protein ITPRID2 isoform X1 [Tachysurus fulvidraco]
MEECELPPAGRDHPWKTATMRRMAWAQSRESWQAPESEEPLNNNNKPDETSETGPIPNNIASWLRECRTPLGASLDEQSNSPTKGPLRNGCSFEDDLSLGAEAHLLQSSSAKPDPSSYDMQALEKRSRFRQKSRSMNSTGSGKSSGTVSSVSELLDLYEEDPEEILYNLGFGREEPDIASKIPSRFFNTSSGAKGIDIKVYLGAQMQRMELENPNYALTSRFRQTEVLATVANVFSEIYSQVSGRPVQKICPKSEAEPTEPPPLRRNSSTLNAVKILKKNLTRPNLMALAETMSKQPSKTDSEGTKNSVCEPHSDAEPRQKIFRRKDSLLATVTEESNQSGVEVCDSETENSKLVNGERLPTCLSEKPEKVGTDVCDTPLSVSEQSNGEIVESESSMIPEGQKTVSSSSIPDKETCPLLPNPHMAHLLSQPRDSFEMEELQSNEDEAVSGTRCFSIEGSEPLLRTGSQQSDSSGFAEDPSSEGSANSLKVQESSDSCDSETTVKAYTVESGTPGTLEHPAFERLLMDQELLMQTSMGLFGPMGAQVVPELVSQQVPSHFIIDKTRLETAVSETETHDRLTDPVIETGSSTESLSTVEFTDPEPSIDLVSAPNTSNTSEEITLVGEQDMTADSLEQMGLSAASSSSNPLEPVLDVPTPDQSLEPVPESQIQDKEDLSTSSRVRSALLRAQQRTTSCEDQRGRVWIRSRDLLKDLNEETRNPLQRSSSLPTTLLSPARVVSSVHIQLGHGSVRQCTPPCYSYRYEEEPEEVTSIAGEQDDRSQSRHPSNLVDSDSLNLETELDRTGVPPYPMNVPQHLTRSTSSLYSTPADWPLRHMAEAPVWSTNSVPDLTQHTRIPHPAIPRHIQQELPQFRGHVGSPYQKPIPVRPLSRSYTPVNSPCPCTQSGMYSQYPQPQNSPFFHSVYTPPHGSNFPNQNISYTHPHCMPYHPQAPFQSPPLTNPYGSSFNLQMHSNLYNPQVPLTHSYSAPSSLAFGNTPYNPNMPYRHHCNSPFHTPPPTFSQMPFSFPSDTPTPPPTIGSTEMQLRRVLHEIRGTMQSYGQTAPDQHEGTQSGVHSPVQAVQPLHEELQRRLKNLKVFRTQMMDLELALMRQQSMVYQLLTPEERQEAEQLQRLRVAVRQELQELELQLEDQLLTLDDRIHSAHSSRLSRHLLDMSRGQSMDSLSSSSALRATEPVTDLLREQMYLQSELSYDGTSAVDTPTSARSSRSVSPVRSRDLTSSPSRRRGGVYRSTVSLTPSIPSRSGNETREQTPQRNISPRLPEVIACRTAQSVSDHTDVNKEPSFQKNKGEEEGESGGEEAFGNANIKQLIHQIKKSLADEIRQEIVNEILAAVSPQRSVATQESAP